MPVPSILPLSRREQSKLLQLSFILFFPQLYSPVHGRTVRSGLPWGKTSLRVHASIWVEWILIWLL